METFDKVMELLHEQGKDQKELADAIGVSQQKIADWKAGRLKSYVKYIDKMADFFGVSMEYILGSTTRKKPIIGEDDELGDIDKALLDKFKSLSPESQAKVLEYADLLQLQRGK